MEEVAISPIIELPGVWSTNWRTIVPKKFLHSCKNFRPYNKLPNLGIQQRNWESPGNLALKVSQQDLITELSQDVCTPKPRRKEQWPQKRVKQTCLCVFWSLQWRLCLQWPVTGSGTQTAAILGDVACWYKSFWRRSPLSLPWFGLRSSYMEGTQSHPPAANWIKDLLSMALLTRTRFSFPYTQLLPSGRLHKPLILIHQSPDRMCEAVTANAMTVSLD